MTEKTEMQDLAIKILETNGIEYVRYYNRMFKAGRSTPRNIKYFPDIAFLYKGVFYMREFGIAGSHKDRKEKQLDLMKRWASQGADIAIILSRDAMLEDFKKVGLM